MEIVKRGNRKSDGEFWADKLMDLANLSAVVLIFGQFVTDKTRWIVVIGGIMLYVLILVICDKIKKR